MDKTSPCADGFPLSLGATVPGSSLGAALGSLLSQVPGQLTANVDVLALAEIVGAGVMGGLTPVQIIQTLIGAGPRLFINPQTEPIAVGLLKIALLLVSLPPHDPANVATPQNRAVGTSAPMPSAELTDGP